MVDWGGRGWNSKDSGRGSGRCSGRGSCRTKNGKAKEDEVWVWKTGRNRVDMEGVGKRISGREDVVDVGKGRCRDMLGMMGWGVDG